MLKIGRVSVVEYLDDAVVMKNVSVLYKIEPLRDGEIGIMRKLNSVGKRPPRREMNISLASIGIPSSVGGIPSSVGGIPSLSQTLPSLRPLTKQSLPTTTLFVESG